MTSTLEAYDELSFDVIVEILTWLPVKSLLRFKCVCKQWCSLIKEDRKFIAKHKNRATPLQFTYLYKSEDSCIVADCGLLLEKGDYFGSRIRNPATKQVIYLPYEDEYDRLLHLYYDLVTGECKAVRNTLYGNEIMTVGKDEQWRALCNGKSPWGLHLFDGAEHDSDVAFDKIARDSDQDLEIHSLDMRSESVTTNTVPRGAFADQRNVWLLFWKGGLLAVGDIENEALNVLVLEDFKEHNWSKNKIVVPLKFLNTHHFQNETLVPRSCYSDELKFYVVSDAFVYSFSYDMKREKIKESEVELIERGKERMEFYTPSLVTIKGMIPENAGPIASDIST